MVDPAILDVARESFFEKGNRWSGVESYLRDLYPELTQEDLNDIYSDLNYRLEQLLIQIKSSEPRPGDILRRSGHVVQVKWIQGDEIGARYVAPYVVGHTIIKWADWPSWQNERAQTTQTGDNFGEDLVFPKQDKSQAEESANSFTKDRDRLTGPKPRIRMQNDPGTRQPPHSEIGERVTQPPRDGA